MSHDAPRTPFRRPAALDSRATDAIPGNWDPTLRGEIAHTTAAAIVNDARALEDPDVVERLIRLVDTEGLDEIAALWADSPANTLPGALWRIYVLREWVRRDGDTVTIRYRMGVAAAPAQEAIAGAAGTSPADMLQLADAVLSGVFSGDLAAALDRGAAFCWILAAGAAFDADAAEVTSAERAERMTRNASSLVRTAEELRDAAVLWRAGKLD